MAKRYYMINGWEENIGYFFGIGGFTEEEKQKLDDGEVVEKDANRFWITTDEFGRPECKVR